MITVAVSTLQKRRKEIIAVLTTADDSVIILYRDSTGQIKREVLK